MQGTELAVFAYTADGAALALRLKKVLGEECRVFLHSASSAGGITEFTDTGSVLEQVWA